MSLPVQFIPGGAKTPLAESIFVNHGARIRPDYIYFVAGGLYRIGFDERSNLTFVIRVTLGNHFQSVGLM